MKNSENVKLTEAMTDKQMRSALKDLGFRHLTRRLKAINPNEAVTEEELQEQIKRSEN